MIGEIIYVSSVVVSTTMLATGIGVRNYKLKKEGYKVKRTGDFWDKASLGCAYTSAMLLPGINLFVGACNLDNTKNRYNYLKHNFAARKELIPIDKKELLKRL